MSALARRFRANRQIHEVGKRQTRWPIVDHPVAVHWRSERAWLILHEVIAKNAEEV